MQRLRSAGDNDQRLIKNAFVPGLFFAQVSGDRWSRHVIRLQVIVGPNMRDQSVFCAFQTFLVEVLNAGYIQVTHA